MDMFSTTFDYLRPGGLIMIPLIGASCWMWVLIIERGIWFADQARRDISLRQAMDALKDRILPTECRGLRADLVRQFLDERTGRRDIDRRILERHAMRARPLIRGSLAIITTLAAVAPLFGLLGTVTGMITTFDVISLFGTGNAKAMAGGISEALITTQSGLLAAIPGLFMSVFLHRRATRLEGRLDETVSVLKRCL
ncbi:biopolymer transport protein ExbB [Desulfomicrobium macestii]|uniref:Biopolymer transport protein ExbB n=1 Tax=Desulfomicrobium macestii TaxID=90731 RepID=A0ABR9H688_9BACT|nr:MotA/TolQ/ExbB proton channel family protein [Desulfomicrobium macestii]MBE1426231.1 biopolymer transport protein ExbB [Desulfomicrobium macestii]